MKRIWVVIVNILIMFSMLTFVFIYSTLESRDMTKRQVEHFESSTVTMEHVTENYLEGEQRICDVWAHYINSENMTIQEAVSFVRISHVLPNASAHIVYCDDTLSGYSTRDKNVFYPYYPKGVVDCWDYKDDLANNIHQYFTCLHQSCERPTIYRFLQFYYFA